MTTAISAEMIGSTTAQPVNHMTTAPASTPTEDSVSPRTCRNALRTFSEWLL